MPHLVLLYIMSLAHSVCSLFMLKVKKVKGGDISPSQSYGASPAVWDHTSVTCYPTQVNVPRLSPSQIGWYSIYLLWRDERLS